jgi:WD40 repeat protein
MPEWGPTWRLGGLLTMRFSGWAKGLLAAAAVANSHDVYGVQSVTFSPDGKTLAAADFNSPATYLWDVATHALVAILNDPDSTGVAQASFSPDGKLLATADWNGRTYLWDIPRRGGTRG